MRLRIRGNESYYHLDYAAGDGDYAELAKCEARYLSKEVAGGFTGVYLAIYATGNGRACAAPADFDWFDYGVDEGQPAPHWE